MKLSLHPLQPEDLPALLALLQAELPAHTVSEPSFVRKVLLDPNYEPETALIAWDQQHRPAGFVHAVKRRQRFETGPDDSDRGWITLFAVRSDMRRKSIGTALFDAAEQQLEERGAREIWISPYVPNYWTPGIDEAAYTGAIRFLVVRGYETVSRPLSMAADLSAGSTDWAAERFSILHSTHGLSVAPVCAATVAPLMKFIEIEFPGDWQNHIRMAINDIYAGYRCAEEVMVATSGGEIWGFSHYDGERFGPFGVAQSRRGIGVGAALLDRTLLSMRSRGRKRAWFMWTGDAAARRTYAPAGFVETNRYSIMVRRSD